MEEFEDVGLGHLQTVDGADCHAVPLFELLCELASGRAFGASGVEQDEVGLSQFTELLDDALLGLDVTGTRQISDRTVRDDDQTDGRVLLNHLAGADLGCLFKGDLPIKPRRADHAGAALFFKAQRSGDGVPDTVDEPNFEADVLLKVDFDGFVRYKVGLTRHHRPPGSALGSSSCVLWRAWASLMLGSTKRSINRLINVDFPSSGPTTPT